ncbi:MAG: 3-ketoacyl-ACP reductase [Planctomycetia bacterium]|nr:3-ketoacyl-ACP reductase [Planctomycetia bacterium]
MVWKRTKVAIVTGGMRGIGLGISTTLISEGWSVAICGTRDPSDERVRESLESLRRRTVPGATVSYDRADISVASDRTAFLDRVWDAYGMCTLLVNNAGVAPLVRNDILTATEDSFERVLRINLQGPYFLTQAVANRMLEQRKQDSRLPMTIVCIGSISSTVASVGRGEYCVSKAGVSMMASLFAVRLAPAQIPVFEVRPGVIHSDMTSTVREKYDRLIAEGLIPMNRWGEPEDIGLAVASLASGSFHYATGSVIILGGGMTIPRL